MFNYLFRLLWRCIILAIGLLLVWGAIMLFPYVDARLPLFLALFFIYCIFAYILIPLLIRLLRVVIKPARIPLYATTRDGWASDPVNVAVVVKNRGHLREIMQKAGWHEAEALTVKTGLKELCSIIFNLPYKEAPFSKLYLFDRPHDIGFQISTNKKGSARTRHHVRFWRLEEPSVDKRGHYTFWRNKFFHLLHAERELWIGAATEENKPVDIQWFTGQLTHGGSHNSDAERDFIIHTLQQSNLIRSIHTTEKGEKIRFRGQQFRTFYTVDGSIKVVKLR